MFRKLNFFSKRFRNIKRGIDSNMPHLEGHYRSDLRKTGNNISTFDD